MIYSQEEKDQISYVMEVVKRYLPWVFGVVVIIAGLMLGRSLWSWYRDQETHKALSYYTLLQKGMKEKKINDAQKTLAYIQDHFASTPYAVTGSLEFSSAAVAHGDYDDALKALMWLSHQRVKYWSTFALAQAVSIAIEQKKYDQAKEWLARHHDSLFQPILTMLNGDLALAQGSTKEAISFYHLAEKDMNRLAAYYVKSSGLSDALMPKDFSVLLGKRIRYAESV